MNLRRISSERLVQTELADQRNVDEQNDTRPHRGRSMDAKRDVALRTATLDLLSEIGYDRLTMDAVAARTHASKATIYRRWPNKAALVVDALHCTKRWTALSDTGSLASDLDALGQSSTNHESGFDAGLMLGLVTALAHDSELREVFRERIIDPRTSQLREVFERAVTRGEISRYRNLDLLINLFPALWIQRILITGELPDAEFAAEVINDVILPLATAQHVSPTLPSNAPIRSEEIP